MKRNSFDKENNYSSGNKSNDNTQFHSNFSQINKKTFENDLKELESEDWVAEEFLSQKNRSKDRREQKLRKKKEDRFDKMYEDGWN